MNSERMYSEEVSEIRQTFKDFTDGPDILITSWNYEKAKSLLERMQKYAPLFEKEIEGVKKIIEVMEGEKPFLY